MDHKGEPRRLARTATRRRQALKKLLWRGCRHLPMGQKVLGRRPGSTNLAVYPMTFRQSVRIGISILVTSGNILSGHDRGTPVD